MKKLFFLSALLLMSVVTFAQQALWGGAPVVSPEIHDDNTVTFRLKAPKAIKVQVTGDFLPAIPIQTERGIWEGPGIADLKEGKDGVWEYTTPEPLAPELYMVLVHCRRTENYGSQQRLYDSRCGHGNQCIHHWRRTC